MMPDTANQLLNLQEAVSLHQSGKLQQAKVIYQQILELEPNNADALHLLGLVFHQSGQSDTAITLIKQALEIFPNQLNFLSNLANILREAGEFQQAVLVYKHVIQFQNRPQSAEIYNNLGMSLHKLNRFQQAVQAYYGAIQLNPEYDQAYSNLAAALIEQKQFDEALDVCRQALEIEPVNFTAYCNLGNIYKEQGQFEDAIQSYQQAINIQPNIPELHSNMGKILENSRKPNQAISAYQKALDIDPEYAEIHKNLSVPLLILGNFKQGWKEYEWRWKCDKFVKGNMRDFPQPIWDGGSLNRRSIIIWLEQGVGDGIMFASLLPKLRRQAKRVLVETEYRLLPIFQRSFPEIDFFSKQNPPQFQLLDSSIDFQSPIGSLAQWLLTNEQGFSKNCQYLMSCPHTTQQFREKLQQQADSKLLVGISWSSLNQEDGMLKSASLNYWRDLLVLKSCFFINLQYGDVRNEIDTFVEQTGISIYQDQEINSLESLDDFAAQVSALDLIISIDNTTVHMAGALGKPVWTLLPYAPDWRWQLDRSDTPWYPSMTLYRQSSLGDWHSVFQQVQPDLKQFIEENLETKTCHDA